MCQSVRASKQRSGYAGHCWFRLRFAVVEPALRSKVWKLGYVARVQTGKADL
jgi:hypothetical protein